MLSTVNIFLLLFFVTFSQATHLSFSINTIYSLLFFLVSGFSFKTYNFYKFFSAFLLVSFLLCISYFLSSQSLYVGSADFLLSLRNIFLVVMSCFLADYLKVPARARSFFHLVSFVFIVNTVVVLVEHFAGLYCFPSCVLSLILMPLIGFWWCWSSAWHTSHPNTSAFFSVNYLFFLFLVLRNRVLKFSLLPLLYYSCPLPAPGLPYLFLYCSSSFIDFFFLASWILPSLFVCCSFFHCFS